MTAAAKTGATPHLQWFASGHLYLRKRPYIGAQCTDWAEDFLRSFGTQGNVGNPGTASDSFRALLSR